MPSNNVSAGNAGFKDRKTGLVAFGVFEIVLGGICVLMAAVMLLGVLASSALKASHAPPPSVGAIVPAVLFYILMAVWFVWMGIGSIRCRRWARALLLVTSSIWLCCGVIAILCLLILSPEAPGMMRGNEPIPKELAAFIKYFIIGLMALIYVIMPGVFVAFYGSRHVKATCDRIDARVRWTDKCPLPVLAMSLASGFLAACMPATGLYNWAIPCFGTILNGMAGLAVVLVTMLLLGYVAWGSYRMKIEAWWGATLWIVVWGASSLITFSGVGLMQLYERMGFSAEQLEIMKPLAAKITTSWMTLLSAVWMVVLLAYLLYTRRFFVRKSTPETTG